MNKLDSTKLDRYITGNYGEDQFNDDFDYGYKMIKSILWIEKDELLTRLKRVDYYKVMIGHVFIQNGKTFVDKNGICAICISSSKEECEIVIKREAESRKAEIVDKPGRMGTLRSEETDLMNEPDTC